MYGHISGVLCEWSTLGKPSLLAAHSLEAAGGTHHHTTLQQQQPSPPVMDYHHHHHHHRTASTDCWLPAPPAPPSAAAPIAPVAPHAPPPPSAATAAAAAAAAAAAHMAQLRMSRYDKLIQAAASRLIGYDSDLARYEVHKTVYMKQQLEDRYHRSLEQMRLKHTACMNESSMNKERNQLSESSELDSYQLETNSCEESERFSSPLNSPSGATAAIKSRGIVENSFPVDLPMVLARHGMGLLKTDLATSDTSQLLREILQNKDKHQLQELANNNNNINNNNNNTNNKNNVNRLNGSTTQDSSCLITKLLKNTSQQQKGSLSDTEKLSCHSTEGSAEESDEESTIEQLANDEEADVGDVKTGVLLSGVGPQLIDSKEAKRARVENIITSMRHSPTHNLCDSQNIQEQRRQKRKQHQPQQHELSPDHTDSKMRKMTKEDFNRQLMELQNQINDMQKKYSALYHGGERHPERSTEGGDDDEDCHTTTTSLSHSASNRMGKLNGEIDPGNRGIDGSDIDPVLLINHASQMVREQEIAAKRTTPFTSLHSEVQSLASSLKIEIIQAVDTIFGRFAQTQALKSPENSSNRNKTPDQASTKERSKSPTNSAEYTPEFYALPRVHDKQTLFDATCRNTPDLPRAHNRTLPFPPQPPHHSTPQSLSSFFTQSQVLASPVYNSEPEQTEALSLVVNTPKKKRTKVTDTRLSPRAARALLQDNCVQVSSAMSDLEKHIPTTFPHILPPMLPTSVAIPNPSLQHSDILGYYREPNYMEGARSAGHSPLDDHGSPGNTTNSLSDSYMMLKSESYDMPIESDGQMSMISFHTLKQLHTTLTPMHLRKAKLMFFYVRYPSSAILKVFFPDIRFNKNNTAQLVKWFSNFREFYYIQMEKYAKQAIAEGYKNAEDLIVTTDSELYRVLNLHYNRNNQIEVPENFRIVVQATLREFFKAISSGKDSEQSWKKAIYKIISRMDDTIPEFFKSPNWMEQLGDA